MTVTWVLTQTGSTVSGTVKTTGPQPKRRLVQLLSPGQDRHGLGNAVGDSADADDGLSLGHNGEVTSACTVTFSGIAATIANDAFTTAYSGTDSCEGLFLNGTLDMALQAAPSITTQPASQTIASGQTATLSVVATGTAPLTYQWYVGHERHDDDADCGRDGEQLHDAGADERRRATGCACRTARARPTRRRRRSRSRRRRHDHDAAAESDDRVWADGDDERRGGGRRRSVTSGMSGRAGRQRTRLRARHRAATRRRR